MLGSSLYWSRISRQMQKAKMICTKYQGAQVTAKMTDSADRRDITGFVIVHMDPESGSQTDSPPCQKSGAEWALLHRTPLKLQKRGRDSELEGLKKSPCQYHDPSRSSTNPSHQLGGESLRMLSASVLFSNALHPCVFEHLASTRHMHEMPIVQVSRTLRKTETLQTRRPFRS